MWLGRGTWFPLTQGWYGGIRTDAAQGLGARVRRVWLVGPTDADVGLLECPANLEPHACRDIPADRCQRESFLYEVSVPHVALARGPPDRGPRQLYFHKRICEICCIDKEK